LSRLPGKRARPVLRGPRRSNAPGLPDECEFTALRYFTLDGSEYPSHSAQENAIAGYVRWRNKHAKPKRDVAVDSKIRRPDYLPIVA
jgi:hypothetical protein